MRFKYFILGILLVLLFESLCGCIVEERTDEDGTTTIEEESDLEVVSYTVETQKLTVDRTFEKIADGFIHNEDAYRYLVCGKVKNNSSENISKAYVFVNFYDRNGTLLYQIYDMIFHVAPNVIEDFTADFTKYDGKDFPDAERVEFTFKQEQ